MDVGGGAWADGRRAWDRLTTWLQAGRSARSGSSGDGGGALDALADIGALRRLLDQAELAAVRTARSGRKSWAEIATHLGVTRQSAWERWRELDVEPAGGQGAEATAAAATELTLQGAARERRRRSTVQVPNVVGLQWSDARTVLSERGLVAMNADPDAPPPLIGEAGWVVTDQSPESGARVGAGTIVRLWVERGGGSGVREPRNPRPVSRTGRAMLPEPSDEAVG